jgi:hypothetical protein
MKAVFIYMIFDLSTRRRGEADEIDVLIWWWDEGFKYSLSLSIFGTGAGTDIDTDINANANAGAMLCYAMLNLPTHSPLPTLSPYSSTQRFPLQVQVPKCSVQQKRRALQRGQENFR